MGKVAIDGNPYDTGKKWIDGNGAEHIVYGIKIALGALPNAATKTVAHGRAIDTTKRVAIKSFFAAKAAAGAVLGLNNSAVAITVDGTNVNLTTTADQSSYVTSEIQIEYCQATDS